MVNGVNGHSTQQGLGNGAPGTSSGVSVDTESTPDTSLASVDENDLTAEYDRFARNEPLDDFDQLEQVSNDHALLCKDLEVLMILNCSCTLCGVNL